MNAGWLLINIPGTLRLDDQLGLVYASVPRPSLAPVLDCVPGMPVKKAVSTPDHLMNLGFRLGACVHTKLSNIYTELFSPNTAIGFSLDYWPAFMPYYRITSFPASH